VPISDVLVAIEAHWNAEPVLAAAVPSGLWFEQTPERIDGNPPPLPSAVFFDDGEQPSWSTGPQYFEITTIRFQLCSNSLVGLADLVELVKDTFDRAVLPITGLMSCERNNVKRTLSPKRDQNTLRVYQAEIRYQIRVSRTLS
jgi:hypothetical protein